MQINFYAATKMIHVTKLEQRPQFLFALQWTVVLAHIDVNNKKTNEQKEFFCAEKYVWDTKKNK
jgi:hypothetical protein